MSRLCLNIFYPFHVTLHLSGFARTSDYDSVHVGCSLVQPSQHIIQSNEHGSINHLESRECMTRSVGTDGSVAS
mgnify:CR=1 FL=1